MSRRRVPSNRLACRSKRGDMRSRSILRTIGAHEPDCAPQSVPEGPEVGFGPSQREPKALASFRWVVDAKEPSGNTEYEDWWSKVARPFLQTISIRDPFPELEDGDYSHFVGKPMAVPEHVVKQFPDARGDQAFSIRRLELSSHPPPVAVSRLSTL
jgi:hypothetical protein